MFRKVLRQNHLTLNKSFVLHKICSRASVHKSLHNDSSFERHSSLLLNYGFNHGQMSRILNSPENVLSYSEEALWSNLAKWLNFEVNEKLLTTLSAYPELLTLSPDFIDCRVKELMTLFTKKDIHKLLVTCPTVFVEDFSTVYDKVEYIVHMMGIEQKSIVKYHALQFDLFHIKCRHTFITRAGCFILKKQKNAKSRNPPIGKILNRNMQTYLRLTKLTEEEYEVFSDVYKQELIDQELNENNSDDEFDNDSDDDLD